MLASSYTNQYMQKYCVENIIITFFNRAIIVNPAFFVGFKMLANNIKEDDGEILKFLNMNVENIENCKKEFEYLFQLFLAEEYILTKLPLILQNEQQSSLEIDYQKELYKYVLSSHVIFNKNFDFNNKFKEEIIKNGLENLKIIFEKFLIEILNKNKLLSGQEEKINKLIFERGPFDSNLFIEEEKISVQKIRDNLFLLILKQKQNIEFLWSSPINNYYFEIEFMKKRDNYLNILKDQLSPENKRII